MARDPRRTDVLRLRRAAWRPRAADERWTRCPAPAERSRRVRLVRWTDAGAEEPRVSRLPLQHEVLRFAQAGPRGRTGVQRRRGAAVSARPARAAHRGQW